MTCLHFSRWPCVLVVVLSLALAGCAGFFPRPQGIGAQLDWGDLSGWSQDRHAEAWTALLRSCGARKSLSGAEDALRARWTDICREALTMPTPDDSGARRFFEIYFVPHEIIGARGQREALITGYYEPVLNGSWTRTARFRYPLYQRPADLLTLDLEQLYPELRGKPLRGRLEGQRVVPYYSRREIGDRTAPLQGHELLWVEDPVALFFLHIQGSGRVRLADGTEVAVGYADQNGHPYVAVGKCLADQGILPLADITLSTIRAWLAANPTQVEALLNCNPSYIFFARRDADEAPLGALEVPLIPSRSVAVDSAFIPLGLPLWLDTALPGTASTYQRLVFAQDTGGAIKGAARADLFCGRGSDAEALAGEMKQPGRLFLLLPRL